MMPGENVAEGSGSVGLVQGPAAAVVAPPTVDSRGTSRRKTVMVALLIFVAALSLRIAFFAVQSMDRPALWSRTAPFNLDEMGNIAMNLAQGRGYSSPFGPGSTPTAWLCPLIPLLWAFVIKCVGSATGHTALIIGFIDTIPSAACVVVYWLIARHLLRGSPALRRTAFLVAVLFCVWPESFYELDFFWYFPWQELATALMVLLGMRWIDRPSFRTVIPLGIAGGILALINATPMPIFVVILLLPVFKSGAARWRVFGLGTAGAILSLLIVMPWMVRNAVVFHTLVPLRSNAGFQFWEGNNIHGCVRENASSMQPSIQSTQLKRYQAMGEIAYSRSGFPMTFAYIKTHPRQAFVRTLERAYVFWLTDVLDHWRWDKGMKKWWNQGRPAIVKALSSTLAAWGLVILTIWAFVSKRVKNLPYKGIFISILFFLPLPYYFTLAENEYSQILRSWLLLLVILAFSAGFRAKQPDLKDAKPES